MKSLQKGGERKAYNITANLIARDRPQGVIQVIALGKDNRAMLPKDASHVLTIKGVDDNTPTTILYDGSTLYVME